MMKCSNCQTANPEGAKFCFNCGNSLINKCTNCETELPSGAKFCFNCGTPVGGSPKPAAPPAPAFPAPPPAVHPYQSAAFPDDGMLTQTSLHKVIPTELIRKLRHAKKTGAMEGERRIVTMLFCDIKGSTAAAGQLDPEEWAEIMNGAFEYMIRPVYRFEGTLARLMGDAILAFFGAPIAHEDDPERAVRAALDIVKEILPYRQRVHDEWGVDINVRVGINTGLVVVGAVGSDLRMEYSALGDAINLAARMEQLAEPGTIQIAEPTYKIIAPLFDVEDLGGVEVKGKTDPVNAYRVLREKTDPGRVRGIEGLDSPIVGRDAEMHALRGAVIELRRGRGQIISLIGEAGLGKSRLVTEIRNAPTPVSGAKVQLRWREGRSLSYETNTPYAPFIDLFTECFNLAPTQDDDEKYEVIKKQVGALNPGHEDHIAPFIASLLNLRPKSADMDRVRYLDPPQLRGAIFNAVAHYFDGLAKNMPTILVFDDVHWIDPTSLDLLESLLPLTDHIPLMLLALFRPRRQEPSWRFHETAQRDYGHRYAPLFLNPLGKEDSRALVANLLHVEDLPERVRSLILEKAEGNPFYVEEVIRSLLDSGLVINREGHWHATKEIEDIQIPDTLAAVITTRLDRLDEVAKHLVQTASVIGREFQFEVLETVYTPDGSEINDTLTKLQRKELVREKARLPRRLFTFKHNLTQETAYRSLLLKQRRGLHLKVAETLERSQPDRVEEIARHFLEARKPERALPYLVDAADKAAKAYATAEAIGYYQQALTQLEQLKDFSLIRRVYEGLGNALTFAQRIPEAVDVYQAMADQAKSVGDKSMEVSALNKLALTTALYMGQFENANQYLEEADALARTHNDKPGISELSLIRCMMCTAVADFEGVVNYMDETVALGRELNQEHQMAMGFEHIASSQMYMGLFDQGWETIQEGLALTRKIGDRAHEAGLLISESLFHLGKGDLPRAEESANQASVISEMIGSVPTHGFSNWALGYINWLRGDYETAIEYQKKSLRIIEPFMDYYAFYGVMPLGSLGNCYLEIGNDFSSIVQEYHERALKLLENPLAGLGGGSVYAEVGLCAYMMGENEIAIRLFQSGMESSSVFKLWETPRYLAGFALVALSNRELETASDRAFEARAFAHEKQMKYLYPFVELVQGQVAAEQAEYETALTHFEEGERLALEMGMRSFVWQNRAGAAYARRNLGRTAEAEAMLAKAHEMTVEIAGLFKDDDLRAKYLQTVEDKLAANQFDLLKI